MNPTQTDTKRSHEKLLFLKSLFVCIEKRQQTDKWNSVLHPYLCLYIRVFSLSHFFKGKRISTQNERVLQCSVKKKNKCRHNKIKPHIWALPILLPHSGTGLKRGRELPKARMGFNTHRLYLNCSSHILPSTTSLFIFSLSTFPINLSLFVSVVFWSSSSLYSIFTGSVDGGAV